MMKKLLWFIIAFIFISIAYFFLVYLAGWALSLADFRLYNSEADQQRNFNIVMSGWLLLSIAGAAWLSRRKS
ncbi:hypothetical protein [uncultured Microbulbifer sp.]|uniref:hypothetical protein n=1 Tax=uncultured Microbulbifer sp. TaxID=348147 RepID=UPI002613DE6C|nr:hypothetical protein [uncultured Microbulbifer sp.]